MSDASERLDALIEHAANEANRRPGTAQELEQRARFVTAATERRPTSRRPWQLAALAACAATVFVVFWLWSPGAAPLAYVVDGASVGTDAYVSAPAQRPVTLRFTDGTTVELTPNSRLRVAELRASGASLLLEQGTARANVQHRGGARWTLLAGPFEVRVIGTRFDLSWDGAREAIDLRLHEGRVEVSRGDGTSSVSVRAGERLLASARDRSYAVAPLGSTATEPFAETGSAATSASAPATSATTAPSATTAATAPTASSASGPRGADGTDGPSWSKLTRAGRFDEVLRLAEARGLDGCIASCGAAELSALADSARYRGKSALAERALLSLRSRFPGSASVAAFLLGRLQEARGAAGAADGWYRTYLNEAPRGAYAADALVGRMRLASGATRRALAQEVLRLHPTGVHAEAARKVLATP